MRQSIAMTRSPKSRPHPTRARRKVRAAYLAAPRWRHSLCMLANRRHRLAHAPCHASVLGRKTATGGQTTRPYDGVRCRAPSHREHDERMEKSVNCSLLMYKVSLSQVKVSVQYSAKYTEVCYVTLAVSQYKTNLITKPTSMARY